MTSSSRPPVQSDGGFRRAQQLPSPSPRSPPKHAGPPCPCILQRARLKHPAGGWERLAALPRRFSFIKHKAGGGFSHAVGTAESLFSAASGRKMEGGQETGRPVPPPAARGTASAFVQFSEAERGRYGGFKDIMMALNVVKEQHGVGRLRAAKAGARRGLVVTDGGSGRAGHKDRAKPLTLGICRVGVFSGSVVLCSWVVFRGGDRAPSRVPTHGPWGSHTTPRSRGRSGATPANPEETNGPAAGFCSQALREGWVSLKSPVRK